MANSKIKELDNDIKIYDFERERSAKCTNANKISILIYNHEEDKGKADNIERELIDYDIEIKRDIAELNSVYNNKVRVFKEVKYMIVLVSENFIKDWSRMKILFDNYRIGGNNKRIIPLIVQNDLYEPHKRTAILNTLQKYRKDYAEEFCVKNHNEVSSEELLDMTKIIEMANDFLKFSIKRNKKSNKPLGAKVLKYIEMDTHSVLAKNETNIAERENDKMNERIGVINNYYGTVNGMQVQQGNDTAIQNQTVGQNDFDYTNVQKIVEQIKKYDNVLDDTYNDDADKVREIVSEVTALTERKEEPKKIKNALLALKDLSIGVSGNIIASGIINLIDKLNL